MKKSLLSVALLACCLPVQSVLAEAQAPAQAPPASFHKFTQQPVTDAPLWTDQQQAVAEQEAKFLQQIKDSPNDKAAYANLANLYLIHNKTAKAIKAYQDAIIHDGENPKLFAALSIAYLHQSRYAMAKAMADQAVLISPDMAHAKKIQQYIAAKEEAIAQASASDAAMPNAMPNDGTHGSMAGGPHGAASAAPHGSAASPLHGVN